MHLEQIRKFQGFLPLSRGRAPEVLGARTETDETGGKLSQNRKPFQQTQHERQRVVGTRHSAGDDSAMNEDLHALDQSGWPFTARLHFAQIVNRNWTAPQFLRE